MTNNTLKIGTHDSATGEQGRGLISWLLTPFARTQSKSIKQQLIAGCTLFDIRIRWDGDRYVCAHGPWTTCKSAFNILSEINFYAEQYQKEIGVTITYEGRSCDTNRLANVINVWKMSLSSIHYGPVCLKYGKDASGVKVKYDTLFLADPDFIGYGGTQGFLPLDGRSWHTYLPIPWLWDRLYKRPHIFNSTTYTYVDFL